MAKRKSKIHHQYNLAFMTMFDEFPKEQTESLNMPGKYKEPTSRFVIHNNKELEADAPYIAEPDGEILKETTVNLLEHESDPPSPSDLIRFWIYLMYKMRKTGYPGFLAIASKYPPLKSALKYEISPTVTLKPHYIDLGERDNWERLYRVRNKCRFNKVMSVETGLDLGNAVLFAPDDCARERTREGLHYFLESEMENSRLEFVLCTVFYCTIDAYFDDEEEYRRLIDMIDEKVNPETRKESKTLINIQNRFSKKLEEKDIELHEKDAKLEEKDELINNVITEIDNYVTNSNEFSVAQATAIFAIIGKLK